MNRKNALQVLTVAAALLISAAIETSPAFCQTTFEGTDPQTGLNTQQQTWERDSRIQELKAQMDLLLANTNPADNATIYRIMTGMFEYLVARMNEPATTAPAANAAGQAQANAAGNAAGDVARDQAIAAIDYASRFLKNFTSEKGNKWNTLRDNIFVPIALLLILPGAVLTQMKSIISQGSPVIAQTSPFEGIQRSLVAIFLIPGSYLVVNYSIDFANSIQYTIATEYNRLFGSNMYKDAICAEIRAFGVRYISENDGSLQTPPPDLSASSNGEFSAAEGRLWGKLVDPCSGLRRVPANRDDASMPASSIAARLMMNASNAGINTTWAILCAFQMAFFYYLYFVGPIMAALWVWPMKQLRDAFPSWVEGVITLCFWSLFWHTTILLMACFKGTDETGLFVMSALNFLATAAVKHAFDFAGLVRAAGQKASELIEKAGKEGGGGGSGGGGQGQNTQADQNSNSNTQFVTQESVTAYQGYGSAPLYEDRNGDGRVEGVWNSQQGAYVPLPPGQDLFLVSAAGSPDFVSPPNIQIPPMANGAPPMIITQDDNLALFNPATNQYEVQQVLNPTSGEMVPQYVVAEDGRIAVFDGDGYSVPQTLDREADTNTDKYRMRNGTLEVWDQASCTYVAMQAPVAPPTAEQDDERARQSVSAVIADRYFPVMPYPVWKPIETIDENDFENGETESKDFSPPSNAIAPIPEMETASNMTNDNDLNRFTEIRIPNHSEFAVAPPPLADCSTEEKVFDCTVIEPQKAAADKRSVPIVSLESEIEKLFGRLSKSAEANESGLFISRPGPTKIFSARSPEDLLSAEKSAEEQASALTRALGKTFAPTPGEGNYSTDAVW